MFWENFWPNFAADILVGIMLGVLFSFALDQILARRQRLSERHQRKEELLSLLKSELLGNFNEIQDRIQRLEEGNQDHPGLKNVYWTIALNSGHLTELTDDMQMLRRISNAYHVIDTIQQMEEINLKAYVDYAGGPEEFVLHETRTGLINGYRLFHEYMVLLIAEQSFADIQHEPEEIRRYIEIPLRNQ